MRLFICLLLLSSCNVLKNIIGNDSKPDDDFYNSRNSGVNLNLAYPFLSRSIHIEDETYLREVYIEYNGDTVECSSDGGLTFNPCNFPFVWEVNDYAQEHVVRVTRGEDVVEERFTPSNIFPGHTFLSCDYEITASETVSAFTSRSFGAAEVVCFRDNVVISDSGSDGPIYNDAPGITYIARFGDYVEINSSAVGGNIFDDATNNFQVVGLNVVGINNSQTAFSLNSDQCKFEDVTIDLSGNSSQGFQLGLSGGSVYISNSYIRTSDTGYSVGIHAQDSNIYLDNTIMDAGYNAIYLWKTDTGSYEIAVKNSQFYGFKTDASGPTVGVIETFSNNNTNSYQVNLADSIVNSGGGAAIYIKGTGGVVDLNLVRTELSRNGDSNVDTAAIRVDTTSEVNTISVDPDSFICNYTNSANSTFDQILDDQSALVSFDPTVMNAHTSNTDIGLCF